MRLKNITLGTIVLAISIGCAPSNPGLSLEGVLAADMTCQVTPTSAVQVEGVLDTTPDVRASGVTYTIAMQVGNSLFNNQQRVYPLMADPDRIIVDHVEVTLQNTGGASLTLPGLNNPYIVPAHGAIASTTSTDPTLGLASAEIIPANYGAALGGMSDPNAEIVAQLRVMGTTVGGSALTSGVYLFPIHLCAGCLFQCVRDGMGCPINSPSCQPGQDGVSGVKSLCGGTPPATCPP